MSFLEAVPMAERSCPSPFGCCSPRISFSDDLANTDIVCYESLSQKHESSDFEFSTIMEGSGIVSDSTMLSADKLFSKGKILPLRICQESQYVDHSSLSEAHAQHENCLDTRGISQYSTVPSLLSSSNVCVEPEMEFCPMSPKTPTCSSSFRDLIRSRKQQIHNVKDGQFCERHPGPKASKPGNPLRMLFKPYDAKGFATLSPSEPLFSSSASEDGSGIAHQSSMRSSTFGGSLDNQTIIQSSGDPITRSETFLSEISLSKSHRVNPMLPLRKSSISSISSSRTSVSRGEGCDYAMLTTFEDNALTKSSICRNSTAGFVASSQGVTNPGRVSGGYCPGKNSEDRCTEQKLGKLNSIKPSMRNTVPSNLERSISNPHGIRKKYEVMKSGRPKDCGNELERSTSYSAMRVTPVLNVPPINLGPARKLGRGSSSRIFSFGHLFCSKKEKPTKVFLPSPTLCRGFSVDKDISCCSSNSF